MSLEIFQTGGLGEAVMKRVRRLGRRKATTKPRGSILRSFADTTGGLDPCGTTQRKMIRSAPAVKNWRVKLPSMPTPQQLVNPF